MKKGNNKWISFNFDDSSKTNVISSNGTALRTYKNITLNNTTKSSNQKSTSFNFMEQLKPKTVEDLAVHSKKIRDVESWLQQNVVTPNSKPSASILLLTGPTGTGKTATINVLCKKLGITVTEWVNPVDQEYEFTYNEAQSSRFLDFFSQSKYTSLCEECHKKITLVEDFPNFVTHNPVEFMKVLEKCFIGATPVVFICTDTSNNKLDLAQLLFPQEVQETFQIAHINFNPCSLTLLRGALKRAQNLMESQPELFNTPSLEVIEAITCSVMGDIRCAVTQYQFAGLKSDFLIPISLTKEAGKPRGTKRKRSGSKTVSTLTTMIKNESLGFFHGLGRVLNPKRIETNGSWRIQCDFNALIDEFSARPLNIVAFLHENYINYFTDVRDVEEASDVLSFAQTFLDKWTDQQEIPMYALWISVLGLMVFNEHKASRWNQIKAPTKLQLQSSRSTEVSRWSRTDFLYYNVITGSNKFHTFQK